MNSTNSTMKKFLDLGDRAVIQQVLLFGSADELAQLQDFHGLNDQELINYRKYAHLQKGITEQCEIQTQKRRQENSAPTSEELSLGTYLESLEPQLRNAVRVLRRKGYNTFHSGFDGFDSQIIMYAEVDDAGLDLPYDTQDVLALKGITVYANNKEIKLKAPYMDIDALKLIWNSIARAMPDLNKGSEKTMIGQAIQFRKSFGF